MHIDYIVEGSEDAPLVRIRSFSAESVRRLQSEIAPLATGEAATVRVAELPFVQADVMLDLHVGERNRGIAATPPHLHCYLTSAGWRGVEGLLEPFATNSAGSHQWLDDTGEVAWLITTDGRW